jgi:SsrA-binding protein
VLDSAAVSEEGVKVMCRHRRARYIYQIEGTMKAGLVLTGSETKSLRAGQADLSDAYASFEGRELWLTSAHIAEYANAGYSNHEPKRKRKLLLHRKELTKLRVKLAERGYTLVPLSIYFKGGYAKVELGLARGKRKADRRESVRERDAERDRRREERDATRRHRPR